MCDIRKDVLNTNQSLLEKYLILVRSKPDTVLDLKVENISGIAKRNNQLLYLVKWRGIDQTELVPRQLMNEYYPQDVIAYLTSLIEWCDTDVDESDVCRFQNFASNLT
ncbi:hypothetical protein GJ496_009579 [Pomphorhynchus laevis]|nr:hypothetical protein GJ496_009579 [Pomphorhynchus laevis]